MALGLVRVLEWGACPGLSPSAGHGCHSLGDFREPGSTISFLIAASLGKGNKFSPKTVWASFKLFPLVAGARVGISGTTKLGKAKVILIL